MPKHKHKKQKTDEKKAGRNDPAPQTADDYLATGVEEEERGEKWRAGDAEKSSRAFHRALHAYESGSKAFPDSFDLAYNMARLYYDLTQQPRLLGLIPISAKDLLHRALTSNERALVILPDNTDALFNNGQLLSSQADQLSERDRDSALQLLQRAEETFVHCYELQRAQLNKPKQEPHNLDAASQLSGSKPSLANAVREDRWVSVLELVTHDDLIDTSVAQIDVYIAMCTLEPRLSLPELDSLNQIAQCIFSQQVSLFEHVVGRHAELNLTKANYTAALLDATFHWDRIDTSTYELELNNAFAPILELGSPHETPQARCDYADALLNFHDAILDKIKESKLSGSSKLQWTILNSALFNLERALVLPNVQHISTIFLHRGDCELWRYRLGQYPITYGPAAASSSTLLKNAASFYQESSDFIRNQSVPSDGYWEAKTKEAVANSLLKGEGKENLSLELWPRRKEVNLLLAEMCSDGLISNDQCRFLLLLEKGE